MGVRPSTPPARGSGLEAWLAWQEGLHPSAIDLGLDRIRIVHARMALARPAACVVTVAGTNGKGSSVAMLEAILRSAGLRVGSYTSPHLVDYNERIRVDGRPVDDGRLCAAFEAVEAARGDVALTYFEFGTLAALEVFSGSGLDCALLEVGLGGRLDAVNIVEPDCLLITSIDLDHRDWLGDDRESIAVEKAAIMRPGGLAVCSDPLPPAAIRETAGRRGTRLLSLGEDFAYARGQEGWRWSGEGMSPVTLPAPALPGRHQFDNAAGVVAVCRQLAGLQGGFRVDDRALATGMRSVRLVGRADWHRLPEGPELVFDVAHNAAAARALAAALDERPCDGRTLCVAGLLRDKEASSILRSLDGRVDRWFCATTAGERGRPASDLAADLGGWGPDDAVDTFDGPVEAFRAARAETRSSDRIVVFGSFSVVGAILEVIGDPSS